MNNYDTLNPMQREAVFTTEGPLLVLAGAGSGKTRALTHRVAYLIEEKGVKPWNILAITFTNKAAGEMRERVNQLVDFGADSVWVSTFHSLCVRILRRFIENLGYTTDFSIYDSDDTKTLMKQIFKDLEVNQKVLKERGVLGVISSAKNEMISPEEFLLSAKADGDSRLQRIGELYMEYQKRLKKNNALDFDDLLVKTVELFQAKQEVLEYYQDRFRYIMVDEYQDTNTVQFKLVSLLAAKYRNICVVGDDDQSIYRFRGANIKNILSFEETFPGAKVIKLEQNYRSTKMILDSANEVIKNNAGRKDKTLWTENEVGERPVFREFGSSFDEAEWVVRDIVKKGGPWKDYAILYRTNAQSRLFEEKCIAYNLPYRLVGGVNFYQRKEIKDILCYLKTIANGRDDLAVQRIINVPKRGIGAMSVARVNMFAMENDMSFYEALERVQAVPGIGKAALKIGVFTDQIGEFRKMLREEKTIKDVIEAVLEKTGYREELKEEGEVEAESRLENIEELINKAVSYWESADEPSLSEFLEEVALVADIDSMDESEDRIILMTLHSAKGLEFPYVYLVGMEDGLFPSMMSLMEGPEALEEERRLCYVGITRAEKRLTLTAAKSRMVKGEMQYARTSRFINEIPDVCLERPDQDDSKSGWRKTADAYKDLAEEAGLPWAKSADASGKAEGGHSGRFKDRPSGVSLFGQKSDAYKSPYASKTSGTPSSTPAFGKAFTVEKPKNLDYSEGDRVHHMRFGDGTVKAITDGGKDFEVTVEFDRETVGTRKMFASFAKLKKI
ncbi:ATP-dependent DNA helicase PcrA [Clostridium sp. AM16-23]|jgi:DNA helicase-2/ATP-dependent DNA helicase PcrA|nr:MULTISPECIES: UvrD-helicase domain-containing protein [unclassified Clostridium]RHO05487.1 ATP-dependent DNA helicase PcrA [Clostridium sp. AM22-16AC]RHO38761.1 ATP-dependent DNA helicase PcrA [Clostridium sp. AM16-23]RHR04096.1 ATP-dependent DNA helicase PcrA [Clostridium sp. AF20-17LB]RHS66497.1 ATP-dependent DNA helicase PcrA [Clostridium sp. AM45-5]